MKKLASLLTINEFVPTYAGLVLLGADIYAPPIRDQDF